MLLVCSSHRKVLVSFDNNNASTNGGIILSCDRTKTINIDDV